MSNFYKRLLISITIVSLLVMFVSNVYAGLTFLGGLAIGAVLAVSWRTND